MYTHTVAFYKKKEVLRQGYMPPGILLNYKLLVCHLAKIHNILWCYIECYICSCLG